MKRKEMAALRIVRKKRAKKAVITILGTIGGNARTCKVNNQISTAYYKSKIAEIEESEDVNSLPILIKTYSNTYDVISIHTKCAKQIQQDILKNDENRRVNKYIIKDEWLIEDELDYDATFSLIDKYISQYEKVIIDVSHGFRHLPILMIINAITHNIERTDKIEKILFAKEIERNKEYEFIDLKRYLDLANISYALTTFDRNYTVANNIKIEDNKLQEILDGLSDFSKHILANSLDGLLEDRDEKSSIIEKLYRKIDNLLNSDEDLYKNIERLLKKVKCHLEKIRSYKDRESYEKLYYLSKNMFEKGYLLNSITLLNEAIGVYALTALKNFSPVLKEIIEAYEQRAWLEKDNKKKIFRLYDIYSQAKEIYKMNNLEQFRGVFLEIKNLPYGFQNQQELDEWNKKLKKIDIMKEISKLNRPKTFRYLIRMSNDIRNNLAHANTSKRLEDVEKEIEKVLDEFKKLVIEKNILSVQG